MMMDLKLNISSKCLSYDLSFKKYTALLLKWIFCSRPSVQVMEISELALSKTIVSQVNMSFLQQNQFFSKAYKMTFEFSFSQCFFYNFPVLSWKRKSISLSHCSFVMNTGFQNIKKKFVTDCWFYSDAFLGIQHAFY